MDLKEKNHGFMFFNPVKAVFRQNLNVVYEEQSDSLMFRDKPNILECYEVPLKDFDRVLLISQIDAKQNGTYHVTRDCHGGLSLKRSTDEICEHMTVAHLYPSWKVDVWVCVTKGPIIIGQTPILFAQLVEA